jgi:uncharacterized protein (UPF0333 family)
MVNRRAATMSPCAGLSRMGWLVVIAGIVLLVIYAAPYIEEKFNDTRNVRAMQNARLIATIAADAQAAGNVSIGTAGSLSNALDQMRDGVTGEGALSTMRFSIDNMNQAQINEAELFLEWGGGTISYIGPGSN